MKKLLLIIILLLSAPAGFSQIIVVKRGKPAGRIIVDNNSLSCMKAASLLNFFVKKITGAELPVVNTGIMPRRGDIVINSGEDTPDTREDGFSIKADGQDIVITGGKGTGAINGVVTLLENYCGVRYYAAHAYSCPKSKNLVLPSSLDLIENPAFRYRQTQAYSLSQDTIYKLWHRLEQPEEIFAAGYWVHTFDRLLPSGKFGDLHPEYYSLINGIRRPGSASQLCLTNHDVFEIVADRVDSIFRANPAQNMISVSQNDGNFTFCKCENCRAIDEAEGSPSGTIINFMNKLAARFPDKEFSTLAYLYSVPPPKNIKPLPNVNIMLCDIDCMREVSLADNATGQAFMKSLEGWAKITSNIFVWDYGINFDNYVSPFPNFHVLQANMKLFKKNNVSMHFSQIAGSKGGDFSELRSYVVAKLLWNADCDVDSVIQSFLSGYYGKAGPYLYRYMKIQEGALLGSNIPLWIYDTPVTHKNGMLNSSLIKVYRELFDAAEKAVASDSIFLKRVWQQRLSIQFAQLEIARTKPLEDIEMISKELELFRNRANSLGITTLNERNNTIEEYCDIYLKRNLPNPRINLASHARISYSVPPDKPYDKIASEALTDGLLGGATFNESWVGWEKNSPELIIDLGEVKEIETVEADFLHKLGSWILLPKSITCYTSTDNSNFTLIGRTETIEDRSPEVRYVTYGVTVKDKVKARYVKLNIESVGIGPSWHYGVGYPVWLFTDEIYVY